MEHFVFINSIFINGAVSANECEKGRLFYNFFLQFLSAFSDAVPTGHRIQEFLDQEPDRVQ